MRRVDVPDWFHQGTFWGHFRCVIYPVKRVENRHWAKIDQMKASLTITESAGSASPYVVIQTGGEDSVPRMRGEISTGYAFRVAVQLWDCLAFGLLQTSAVINTDHTAEKINSLFSAINRQLTQDGEIWLKNGSEKLNFIHNHTYWLSATAKYCFCKGWTLTQRTILGSSEWRDSWEFLKTN